jgi:tetratricopeptide (TPR) repeat protein
LAQSPRTSEDVLQALGVALAQAGNMERAAQMFERMTNENPNNAAAWNNYAWALHQCSMPDLNEALKAVERALAIAPDNPNYRETRGQVYVARGEWKAAVADLEFALNAMPDSVKIHRALATAYTALGDEPLAAIHREHSK